MFVPKYGIEGPVYFQDKDESMAEASAEASAPQYVVDEAAQTVSMADGTLLYTIFDKAAVRISVREGFGHRRQLVLALASRADIPASEVAVV